MMLSILQIAAIAAVISSQQAIERKFAGEWEIREMAQSGHAVLPSDFEHGTITFRGDTVEVAYDGELSERFRFRVVLFDKGLGIDLFGVNRLGDDSTNPGTFLLNGDTLKLCWNEDPTGPRPSIHRKIAEGTGFLSLRRLPKK